MIRALIARGRAKLNDPKVAQAIRLAVVAAGFGALKQLLEDYAKRLEALEERGLVPLDDLVTVRDAAKIDRRVWRLEGEPGPDPAAGILEPDEPELEGDGAELEDRTAEEAPELAERPADE